MCSTHAVIKYFMNTVQFSAHKLSRTVFTKGARKMGPGKKLCMPIKKSVYGFFPRVKLMKLIIVTIRDDVIAT